MFIQVSPPSGQGPIKIEGVKGSQIGARLARLAIDNAFEAMLIGLIPTEVDPAQHAAAIAAQYAGAHLHDGWYLPTADLLAFIQHVAAAPVQDLLSRAHPGAFGDDVVDIETMAAMLAVSIPTVRRMVKAEQIPYLRAGRGALHFVPADVLATLRRGR